MGTYAYLYDYKCSNCGHEIEIIQKISDKPKIICPKCNSKSLKKLISAPSFRLKGGGWYETDFKTGKKRRIFQQMNPQMIINLKKLPKQTPRKGLNKIKLRIK